MGFSRWKAKKTITLSIRKSCEIYPDLAGNGNGVVVAETGGVIGIPIPCSPGASDHLNGWCSREVMNR
jgi:hypothetical protein